ncbi:MAG: hypothetical protein QOG52_1314 [Frankiaceae bacterium]|nr:hypothetical protein [Frankiaceae bacterium]
MGTVRTMTTPDMLALRRAALATSVLHDLDVEPQDDGVRLPGLPDLVLTWWELARAAGGLDANLVEGRERVSQWLLHRRWIADHTAGDLAERARPVGIAVDSSDHPGLDWVELRVLGDALDLGVGFLGLRPGAPDAVEVVEAGVLRATGLSATPWWRACEQYLEDMGALAVSRWRRDPDAPLRPMGDCDVVTLLGSRALRGAFVEGTGGMRAVAVPMRTRGWLNLRFVDPAFVTAAAAATDSKARGFSHPVLITADEVAIPAARSSTVEIVLRDQVVDTVSGFDRLPR